VEPRGLEPLTPCLQNLEQSSGIRAGQAHINRLTCGNEASTQCSRMTPSGPWLHVVMACCGTRIGDARHTALDVGSECSDDGAMTDQGPPTDSGAEDRPPGPEDEEHEGETKKGSAAIVDQLISGAKKGLRYGKDLVWELGSRRDK
jgi:hypothetical protein